MGRVPRCLTGAAPLAHAPAPFFWVRAGDELATEDMPPEDTPERMLWRAVLEDALRLILTTYASLYSQRAAREAHTWFFSADTGHLSVIWLCDHLGYDLDDLRTRVRAATAPYLHSARGGAPAGHRQVA